MAYKDDATNTSVIGAALDPRFRRLKFLYPEESLKLQVKVQVLALEAKRRVTENQRQQHTTEALISALQRRGLCLCWMHCLGRTQEKYPARMKMGMRQMSSVIQ